ncbi:MAG: urea ABC transporter ATP-binding subunit UrtE [Chloroflexi bacterium]|nr:urea ABC transporter ATP-binding subunit UrtE [Chloroflexota bacterium]
MLEIHALTVGYGDGVVLTDVDLSVQSHQAACLLGRNGVGKTTLLKTLMGLLRPRTGRIDFDGHDITRLSPNARARLGIGYVPQGRMIFPQLSVTDNLIVGLEAASGRRAAERLASVYELFPVLNEMGKRQAGMLSGGQQQQLAIGRALIASPRLLVLDEPTEGIQPSIVLEIRRVLRQVRERLGVSILLAEQFLDFADGLADDMYVLDGGTVALEGSVETLDRSAVTELLAV